MPLCLAEVKWYCAQWKESGPARRQWGAMESYNWRQAVNALSTWKLQLASVKAGSTASPVNLTVHRGRWYVRGWSLVIRLCALLWMRHDAKDWVALTSLGPSRYSMWKLNKSQRYFFRHSFDRSQKCPSSLCPQLPPPQSRTNTWKNKIIALTGMGKWYTNDQMLKCNVMKTTLPHVLLIHFIYHTAIYRDMGFNTQHQWQDKNYQV